MSYLLLVLGGLGLYLGGEWLVSSSSRLALAMGLSSFVVGLTVVAFGTSAPELAATITSTMHGANELALGNVMGSNIANVALVLGITAIVAPIAAPRVVMRREFPTMLLITAGALALFYWKGELEPLQGTLMLLALLLYIGAQLRFNREACAEGEEENAAPLKRSELLKTVLILVLSLLTLALGARAMVFGAVDIANSWGLSQRVIGLTVVALGTSLPELASSIIAARRGETDMALGGVIGSNIFNLLGILGSAVVVHPLATPWTEIRSDAWVMLGVAVLAWLLAMGRKGLHRLAGATLLCCYAAYIFYIF